MNESLRERPDCHQSKSLILTIHIGMGVMTIDHILFEKGTPATPTHSCMHTYLTFRFQTQKRQLWFDTKIGMSNYLDWKMTHLKPHISSSQNRITLHMANPLNYRSILNEEDLGGLDDQTWFFFHLKSELNEFYFFTFRFHSQS